MKKEKIIILVLLAFVFGLAVGGLVSQGWFDGLIEEITGQATSSAICVDSENGTQVDFKGKITFRREDYYDECKSSKILRDYYCYTYESGFDRMKYEDFFCNFGCKSGVCLPVPASYSE